MTDGFVGFRPLAKQPEGASAHTHRVTLEVDAEVSRVYTTLTSQTGIDQVIDETVKFDARHGGRIRFISAGDDGYGGVYSSLRIGKRVIVLTEAHGQLDFRLKKSGTSTVVDLRASKLLRDDEVASWEQLVDKVASSLSEVSHA